MPETLKILFVGDVVGEPGRRAIQTILPGLKQSHGVHFCVVNGENSAGGSGITPKTFSEIRGSGADVVTSGDHIWDNKDVLTIIDQEERLLRPLNYPPGTPGKGSVVIDVPGFGSVGVLNLMGRTYMKDSLDCPFRAAESAVATLREKTSVIFVDMHAETTSEKIAMGRFLDGKVSAVVGTHTHVATADEQIFSGGTAFQSDTGMTGPHDSILGKESAPIIQRFLTQTPKRFVVAEKDIQLHGVLIEVQPTTGRATRILRIQSRLPES